MYSEKSHEDFPFFFLNFPLVYVESLLILLSTDFFYLILFHTW